MIFRKFLNQAPRSGTPEDRGRVLPWPEEVQSGTHETAASAEVGTPRASEVSPAQSPGRRQSAASVRHYRPQSWLARFAPGVVSGAADVDPALVLTATVAGASFGYSTLWVIVLCVPFLLTVFTVAARIGFQTRRGLIHLIKDNYGRTLAIALAVLIIVINMAMIFADMMAVSEALSIILDQQRIFFVALVGFVVWYILIFRDYHKVTGLLAIFSLPLFVYVVAMFATHPPVKQVILDAVIPRVSADPNYTETVIALFGSLLTPYLLVWQTTSRKEGAEAGHAFHEAEHRTGTAVTTVLCFSIIVAAGTVLHMSPDTFLTTRGAALAIEPVAGNLGPIVFAIGLIGAGLVALPVLVASLCYSLSEAMGWRYGLSEDVWEAKRFYVLISASLFVAAALNFIHMNPVKALYWSQVLAGIMTIPILLFILLLSNDRRVMRTVNSRWQNFWIGAASGGLSAATLLLFYWKARH